MPRKKPEPKTPDSGTPEKLKPEKDGLTFVGFKADAETLEAIRALTEASKLTPGVVVPRSVAIRRALIEAAGRLKK